MTIKSKADIKEMVSAIEADAGIDFPGLADSIEEALSGNPEKVTTPEQVLLKAARRALGLSQPSFAELLKTPVATIRDWEQGRYAPPGAVVKLCEIAIKHPEVVAA